MMMKVMDLLEKTTSSTAKKVTMDKMIQSKLIIEMKSRQNHGNIMIIELTHIKMTKGILNLLWFTIATNEKISTCK